MSANIASTLKRLLIIIVVIVCAIHLYMFISFRGVLSSEEKNLTNHLKQLSPDHPFFFKNYEPDVWDVVCISSNGLGILRTTKEELDLDVTEYFGYSTSLERKISLQSQYDLILFIDTVNRTLKPLRAEVRINLGGKQSACLPIRNASIAKLGDQLHFRIVK